MSFILDALKKSENDRQQQASAEFATVPASAGAPRTPRWIWALIGLLVVNIAFVTAAMLRDSEPATAAGTVEPFARPAQPAGTAEPEPSSFAERISTANVTRPVPRPEPRQAAAPARTEAPVPADSNPQAPVASTSSLALPTLNEIRLDGSVDLPDLHLDIHVFSSAPADRFVFINMQKHREGSTLDSGPRVDEITPNGVVLDYRGTRFVLPRE